MARRHDRTDRHRGKRAGRGAAGQGDAPAAPDPAVEASRRRQVRQIAVVLAGTMALWMFLTWAGGFYGWPPRFAFLIDFLALAAFAWALIVSLRLWRTRHPN